MSNYRIAIQLFGHLRSYEMVFPFLDAHVLQPHTCDIFIHTWTEEESQDISWHKSSSLNYKVKMTDMEKIERLYNPKAIEVEDNSKIHCQGFFNDDSRIPLRGIKAMSHSQIRVNEIRKEYSEKNEIDYEFVLMIRPDIMPLAELDLSRYIAEFSFRASSTIHFTSGAHQHCHLNKKFDTPLASDLFIIAKPSTLDSFFNLKKENFERFYINFPKISMGGVKAPEACFLEALYESGAMPRFYEFPYAIVRTSGNNHIRANFSSVSNFTRILLPSSEISNTSEKHKKTMFNLFFSRFSNPHIEKMQKQINRIKRQLDLLSDKLQAIIENK